MTKIKLLIVGFSLLTFFSLMLSCNDEVQDEQEVLMEKLEFKMPMKFNTDISKTDEDFDLKFKKVLNDIELDVDNFLKENKDDSIEYLIYFEKGKLIIENIKSRKDNIEGEIDFCDGYTESRTCYNKDCVAEYMQEMMDKFGNCVEFKVKRSTLSAKVCARACSDNS